mmetsp:Transcript_9734/g.13136  ORF Transcript_9734/g.13136 Transcript_9734/m.13136 type:complete len:104 (+) Transcript_9734:51-362(+)
MPQTCPPATKDLLQLQGRSMIAPDQDFSFYHPLEIGDFVVQCWGKNQKTALLCGCSIYENGSVVKLTTDVRFRNLSWAKKAQSGSLSRTDLEDLLSDVARLCF